MKSATSQNSPTDRPPVRKVTSNNKYMVATLQFSEGKVVTVPPGYHIKEVLQRARLYDDRWELIVLLESNW